MSRKNNINIDGIYPPGGLIPSLLPVHRKLEDRWSWYKRWHLCPRASQIHAVILSFVVMSIIGGVLYFIFGPPYPQTRAATTTCTWNNGGGTNTWNNAANWSCGNVPNNTNNVVFDGTSNTAVTINTTATAASLTVNTGYTSTITANYGLTLDTAAGGTGSFKILAAANYSANATTITVPGDWDISGGTNTFACGTSTVTLTGTGNLKTPGSYATRFNHLDLPASGTTTTTVQSTIVANSIDFGSSTNTVDAAWSGNFIVYGSGTPVTNIGTNLKRFGFYYRGSAATNVASGTYPGSLFLDARASSVTFSLGGNVSCLGLGGLQRN